MDTEHPAYNNEIERKETNNNINSQQSNSVIWSSDVSARQQFVSFVSDPEVRSEGVTQNQPSTEPESIFIALENNEIIEDQVEVVDFSLNEVIDEEVIID